MNDSKPGNDCGLIIDPTVLADIQAKCRQRAAELEAAGLLQQSPGSPQSLLGAAVCLALITEAERFATAVETMPANVWRFFQHEEPVALHQPESVENKAERRLRESFGGWCG